MGSVKPTPRNVVAAEPTASNDSVPISGLSDLLKGAPSNVMEAAIEWCMANQVADVELLFEDPEEVDLVLGNFLDALPLNAGGIYDKRLRKRLNELRASVLSGR
jgi:hypothetical protein